MLCIVAIELDIGMLARNEGFERIKYREPIEQALVKPACQTRLLPGIVRERPSPCFKKAFCGY